MAGQGEVTSDNAASRSTADDDVIVYGITFAAVRSRSMTKQRNEDEGQNDQEMAALVREHVDVVSLAEMPENDPAQAGGGFKTPTCMIEALHLRHQIIKASSRVLRDWSDSVGLSRKEWVKGQKEEKISQNPTKPTNTSLQYWGHEWMRSGKGIAGPGVMRTLHDPCPGNL